MILTFTSLGIVVSVYEYDSNIHIPFLLFCFVLSLNMRERKCMADETYMFTCAYAKSEAERNKHIISIQFKKISTSLYARKNAIAFI